MSASIPEELYKDVCERYIGGESANSIAGSFGVSHNVVLRLLRKHGIQRRRQRLHGARSRDLIGTKGYIVVYINGKSYYKHRLIARPPKGYVVHHIDGDKDNNDLSNLCVMTNAEHSRLHAEQRYTERHRSAGDGKKFCNRCGEAKPLESFDIKKAAVLGRRTTCRECTNKRRKERKLEVHDE